MARILVECPGCGLVFRPHELGTHALMAAILSRNPAEAMRGMGRIHAQLVIRAYIDRFGKEIFDRHRMRILDIISRSAPDFTQGNIR